jgi:hypothetical protein
MDKRPNSEVPGLLTSNDLNAGGSLWVVIPQLAVSSVLTVVILLFAFWVIFDELPLFAVGFALTLVALQILMVIGLRLQRRAEFHSQNVRPGRFDKFGGLWLFACGFGAMFGWICGSIGDGTGSIDELFYVASIIFSIVLPVLTMLPNIRYISGRVAYLQISILTFITMLPMLVGIYYLLKLFR